MPKTQAATRYQSSPLDPADRVSGYAVSVLTGEIIAGPHVRASCERHLQDIDTGPHRGVFWDMVAGLRAIRFVETILKLNGGEHEGEPFLLLPWQSFIVGSLFGWKNDEGYRRYRQAFVEAGKGCGKTPLAAAIGLYMMVADREPRAEIYMAGAAKDQARVLFRDALAMVDQSPALDSAITRTGRGVNIWRINYLPLGSFMMPIAADSPKSGYRPHCALLDEVHEYTHRTLVQMMRAGTKGRRQALIFMITNSGFDKLTVCYELHEYAIKVASGEEKDDAFFSYVCALDAGDDPFKQRECWIKANPSLGHTLQPRYLEERIREARGMPGQLADVRRLNFCQWTEVGTPWIDAEQWMDCEVEPEPEFFAGEPVCIGIDLSELGDLTAIARAALMPNGDIHADLFIYMAADQVSHRSRVERVPFDLWVQAGYLHTTPGKRIDYEHVARVLSDLLEVSEVTTAAFDAWHIGYLKKELERLKVELPLVAHPQGPIKRQSSPLWMPYSIKMLEKAIVEKRLKVQVNPVLRWCAANAITKADNQGNRIFVKQREYGRIDGVVALAMAIGALYMDEDSREPALTFG